MGNEVIKFLNLLLEGKRLSEAVEQMKLEEMTMGKLALLIDQEMESPFSMLSKMRIANKIIQTGHEKIDDLENALNRVRGLE